MIDRWSVSKGGTVKSLAPCRLARPRLARGCVVLAREFLAKTCLMQSTWALDSRLMRMGRMIELAADDKLGFGAATLIMSDDSSTDVSR